MRRTAIAAVGCVLLASCGDGGERAGGSATTDRTAAPAAPPVETKEPRAMLKVGDRAPDFRVKDHSGKERTLAEFRGKRFVVWFFPKASTGG